MASACPALDARQHVAGGRQNAEGDEEEEEVDEDDGINIVDKYGEIHGDDDELKEYDRLEKKQNQQTRDVQQKQKKENG